MKAVNKLLSLGHKKEEAAAPLTRKCPYCYGEIDIKATKYLTTTFNFQLYYNRAQNYDIQTQLLLSVGLTYTFKNK